jgi:hypothetical protein
VKNNLEIFSEFALWFDMLKIKVKFTNE